MKINLKALVIDIYDAERNSMNACMNHGISAQVAADAHHRTLCEAFATVTGTQNGRPEFFDALVLAREGHLDNVVSQMADALESFLRAPSVGSDGPGSSTLRVMDFNLNSARTALAAARAVS